VFYILLGDDPMLYGSIEQNKLQYNKIIIIILVGTIIECTLIKFGSYLKLQINLIYVTCNVMKEMWVIVPLLIMQLWELNWLIFQ
jgi:hypothetical protein